MDLTPKIFVRYYQKQLLEDQLRERRERLQENRKKEETQRLTDLGYTGGGEHCHCHHTCISYLNVLS